MRDVSHGIRAALEADNARDKVMLTRRAARDWRLGRLAFGFDAAMPEVPGRPARPELLPPGRMPKRGKAQSERGRIALFHALAHIEFVAIDLALDMAGRFGAKMGETFVGDFLAVAADEAMHFALLDRHLATMGASYGDLPAHAGLWNAAHDTRHDVAARLAVVPMVLEARGLDVTPGTIERLLAVGDERGAVILKRILVDEIRHVGFGTNHFVALAKTRGIAPESLWQRLVSVYFRGRLKAPFNDSARRRAGLSLDYYGALAC